MSLAGITSLASQTSTNPSNFVTTRRQDANQLFSALENGDLSGAQTAYNKLASLSSTTNGGPYNGPKLSSDFAAIGQALQNGDLTGAQEAGLQLGQDLLAANQRIHGGGGGSNGGNANLQETPSVIINLSGLVDQVNPNNATISPVAATSSTTSAAATPVASTTGTTPATSSTSGTTSGTSNTGTPPEIVINLGGANGPTVDLNVDGSQIEISLAGPAGSGNAPSAIDLNFGAAANGSPIQLNLGDASSTNPAQAIGISILA